MKRLNLIGARHRCLAPFAFALVSFVLIPILSFASETETSKVTEQYPKRRAAMVEALKSRGIRDESILKALGTVARDVFPRPGLRFKAYADEEIPIEKHQFLSRPYDWARGLELLNIGDNARVLVVDPGIGYSGTLVSQLARETYMIVTVPDLLFYVENRLEELKCQDLFVRSGAPEAGWRDRSPFDRIFIAGVTRQNVIDSLLTQLSSGGTLVVPEGSDYQKWSRYAKTPDGVIRTVHDRCHFPPLEIEES